MTSLLGIRLSTELALREDGLDDSFADEIAQEIERVVQELLAKRGGGILGAWVAWFEYIDKDGDNLFAYVSPEEQRLGTTVGLIRCLDLSSQYEFKKLMRQGDDEED